jgi:hypothetical protein
VKESAQKVQWWHNRHNDGGTCFDYVGWSSDWYTMGGGEYLLKVITMDQAKKVPFSWLDAQKMRSLESTVC